MLGEVTQPSLLSRVRDWSDQVAWTEFEAKYRSLIVRYCRRCGLQTSDAEDVRQLVMIKLAKSLPDFVYDAARGRFRDYLYSALRSAISDAMARPNRARETVFPNGLDGVATASGEADNRWEEEWAAHHYRLAMDQVKRDFEPSSVDAFEKLLAGGNVAAVATALALSEQAVHKAKQRIRNRLRELIEAQVKEEDRV